MRLQPRAHGEMGVRVEGSIFARKVFLRLKDFISIRETEGWHHLVGMGLLAGMGFTVSLFITELAFTQPDTLLPAKTAVLLASAGAGLTVFLFLRLTCRR